MRLHRLKAISALGAALAVAGAAACPAVAAVAAAPTAQPIGAECTSDPSACFTLASVSLEGLTVYKPGDLAPLYDAYLTHEVGPADLAAIASAPMERCRRDG